jgi:hypothetical protein
MSKVFKVAVVAALVSASLGAQAANVTTIDGQGGGGLVPWALLASSPSVSITGLNTQNLGINSIAVNGGIANRVELSYAHTTVDVVPLTTANLASIDNYGFKVKLNDMGDLPQFSIGVVNKQASGSLLDSTVVPAVKNSKSGTDVYIAATKVVNIAGTNVLLNGVIRASKANQLGALGFGGGNAAGAKTGYSYKPEVSAEVFASDNVLIGAEYRAEPANGVTATDGVLHQNAAYDLNIVYIASKNLALTAAYVNLGQVAPAIAGSNRQAGMYLQAQVTF